MNAETVWTFDTKNFRVAFEVFPEDDLDLSWDDDGSVRKGLESGEYVAFVACVAVYQRRINGRHAIGEDYLGNCIYKSTEEFHTMHRGHGYRKSGCYFPDMVREAVAAAREQLRKPPFYVRANAA